MKPHRKHVPFTTDVLSSRAVPCALLSRDAFHAETLSTVVFPAPEVVCLETVNLFSGIKQN